MFAVRRILVSLSFILVLSGLGGCGATSPPYPDPMLSGRIGDTCSVHFRHDALGLATSSPASPRINNFNGAEMLMSGKLLRVNAEWLCIEVGKGEYTIPKDVILFVELPSK